MRGRGGERGMAMIWAMLLLLAFSAFSVSVLQRGQRVDLEAKRDFERKCAFYAAQGGLAWARIEVSGDLACSGKNTHEIGQCRVEAAKRKTVRMWGAVCSDTNPISASAASSCSNMASTLPASART